MNNEVQQAVQNVLPTTGLVRLSQIIGQSGITPEQARANKEKADVIRLKFPVTAKEPNKQQAEKKLLANKLSKIGPRSPRPAIPAMIPVSRSAWWDGVKKERYPAAVKLGTMTTCWRIEDIRALIQSAGV